MPQETGNRKQLDLLRAFHRVNFSPETFGQLNDADRLQSHRTHSQTHSHTKYRKWQRSRQGGSGAEHKAKESATKSEKSLHAPEITIRQR